MLRALVNKIIPFSSVDGPGNRISIFFQGCNFDCLYCHNPETINICKHCGECISVCSFGALSLEEKEIHWKEDKCKHCGLCINTCKRGCGPQCRYMTTEEVMQEILKVKSFISGVTVSGGECTLQKGFLVELFKKVKKLGLTAFIDTNGSTDFSKNKELTDVMDMAMLDIKSFYGEEHKILTGRDNKVVLKNACYLASINKLYEVRTVIVPETLNNHNNVYAISKFIALLNPNIRYKIIKYRSIGVRLDKINAKQPTNELMEQLKSIALSNGCKDVIVV